MAAELGYAAERLLYLALSAFAPTRSLTRTRRVMLHPFFFGAEKWNGISEHMRLLCSHMQGNDYEFSVLHREEDGPQTIHLAKRAGIRIVESPVTNNGSLLANVRELAALYRREQVDILHLHGPSVGSQLAPALAARMAGVRGVVATYHLVQTRRLSNKSRLVARLVHQSMINRVIAVSDDVRTSLADQASVASRKIVTIANGVDEHQYSPQKPALRRRPNEFLLGAFGRLAHEKNQAGLLRLLAAAVARRPELRMVIVGDGPQRPMLESLAQDLGVANHVDFLGFRSDVRDIMAEVDLVVHAPLYEGMPLVLLEAMAASRPIVVNDAPGGLRQVVEDGVNGIVVASSDPDLLADAVVSLVDDQARRERMGKAGRLRWQKNYSAKATAAAVASVYEGLR